MPDSELPEPAPAELGDMTPLQVAQLRLQRYLDAEQRVLQSQSYQVGDGSTLRRNDRASLQAIQEGIERMRQEISRLRSPGIQVSYVRIR